jgi:hypothetical protein
MSEEPEGSTRVVGLDRPPFSVELLDAADGCAARL